MSTLEIIPDELCTHVEIGAPIAGGFLFIGRPEPISMAMCQSCLDWCHKEFANPQTLESYYIERRSKVKPKDDGYVASEGVAICSRGAVIGETLGEKTEELTGKTSCGLHCSACEGEYHHWLPESDDDINDGDPFMVCKHCSATRPMLDSEETSV